MRTYNNYSYVPSFTFIKHHSPIQPLSSCSTDILKQRTNVDEIALQLSSAAYSYEWEQTRWRKTRTKRKKINQKVKLVRRDEAEKNTRTKVSTYYKRNQQEAQNEFLKCHPKKT